MLGCKSIHYSHNVPKDVWFAGLVFLLDKLFGCFFFNSSGDMNKTQKGRGSVWGLMEFAQSWVTADTGTVPAEHMAGTQFITAAASKTSAMAVNFLVLAKYSCFCRIQVMELAGHALSKMPPLWALLDLPGCSLVRLCRDTVGWWNDIQQVHYWEGAFSLQLLPLDPEVLE